MKWAVSLLIGCAIFLSIEYLKISKQFFKTLFTNQFFRCRERSRPSFGSALNGNRWHRAAEGRDHPGSYQPPGQNRQGRNGGVWAPQKQEPDHPSMLCLLLSDQFFIYRILKEFKGNGREQGKAVLYDFIAHSLT